MLSLAIDELNAQVARSQLALTPLRLLPPAAALSAAALPLRRSA